MFLTIHTENRLIRNLILNDGKKTGERTDVWQFFSVKCGIISLFISFFTPSPSGCLQSGSCHFLCLFLVSFYKGVSLNSYYSSDLIHRKASWLWCFWLNLMGVLEEKLTGLEGMTACLFSYLCCSTGPVFLSILTDPFSAFL